jgi:hypothetical protein
MGLLFDLYYSLYRLMSYVAVQGYIWVLNYATPWYYCHDNKIHAGRATVAGHPTSGSCSTVPISELLQRISSYVRTEVGATNGVKKQMILVLESTFLENTVVDFSRIVHKKNSVVRRGQCAAY